MQRCGDVLGSDGLGLGDGSGEEGMVSEVVRLSGQAARGLEDGLHGRRFEERQLGACELQAVREIGPHLVARDASHIGAHHDALRERVERGHAHTPAQLWMADEDDGQPVLGVHRVVGEQAQVLEQLGPEVSRLSRFRSQFHAPTSQPRKRSSRR